MSWIETTAETDAGDPLRALYTRIAGQRGKVSNIMRVQGLNPAALDAHLDLYMTLLFGRSGLARDERELLAVIVSTTNGCDYCTHHHAEALKELWQDRLRVARVIEDYRTAGLSTRALALCEYAHALTETPAEVTEADVNVLRAAGLSDRDVLDANLIVGYFNFANRIANGLGVTFSEAEVGGYHHEVDDHA